MTDQTMNVESLDRDAAADRLEALADALRGGGVFNVQAGNKEVTLDPPESVNDRIDVVEKRSRLRGRRETVTVEVDWKPTE